MRRIQSLLIVLIAAVIAIVVLCTAHYKRASDAREHTSHILAMDTFMTLTAYGAHGEEALAAAGAEIERLDALLSTGNPESEVSMINARGEGTLSEDTEEILSEALEIHRETGGLFDVTIYPIMMLWGFPTGKYRVPSGGEIASTLRLVDSSRIKLEGARVTLGAGQQIDFGAIAKGYTSSRVMEIFREHGVRSGMVSLGGNVQTLGAKPDGSPFRIGIQEPGGAVGDVLAVVPAVNRAVITSGGYERYFEQDGKTYIHIMDPRTGCPAESDLASVTIVSARGMLADALSTSLYIMGREGAAAYWRAHSDEFEAVLIGDDGRFYVTEDLADDIQFGGDMVVLERNTGN